ncbi:Endonuclease [uncultured Candidatus Thioglobus sp.]|nr:Endonuclease [uncultured Candidatus Thioglobus sp.]
MSYQHIKEHISTNLRKSDDINIKEEIGKTKDAIKGVGLEMFARIIGVDNLHNLTSADWQRMQIELETQFNVKMEQGILIKGNNQQNRDTTWWTGEVQKKSESYYWDRYIEYLRGSLPPEVVKTIDDDTNIIVNNIENPAVNQFDRRGMVVGHVQSGKTGNYVGLICKAADAGYKFIVVIAGGMINLRKQTQERLNEGFIGTDAGKQVGVGKGNAQKDKEPKSLTTKEKDFDKQDTDRNIQGTNFENIIVPIVLVIKKNTHSLKNVIDWLDKQYPNKVEGHAMLMIDDESDYASIDTSKPENEPTAINRGLRKIIAKFNKSSYVAYTATPYANIFIDHETEHDQYEEDLFPRDFIYALNAPDNYFGAREIFLDVERKYLVSVNDHKDVIPATHKKDWELPSIPKSLYEAMRVFLLNISIRHLRGQGDKHNSMLVHATRFTNVHKKLAFHVRQYLEIIRKDINVYGKLPNANQQSSLIRDLEGTLDLRYKNLEFSWQDVLLSMCNIVGTIDYREVHQDSGAPLEYRKNITTNAIVVGGTSLSRGYTLEGLSVSYFLRKTVFYDTLMQMGRWFGYRDGYQDLCRIYMPEIMIDNFGYIIEATEDLVDDLKKIRDEEMTPKDFGLAVRQHPDSALQVTARNKQRSARDMYFDMKLDGHSKETSYLSSNLDKRSKNIGAIKNIVKRISKEKIPESKGKRYLWRDVNKEQITNFLNEFEVISLDPFGLKTRMPIDFIKKYTEEQNTDWDVALYSGEGDEYQFFDKVVINKELRKVQDKGDHYEIYNRQVSSGSAESIVLTSEQQKELGSKRKEIRVAMEKPLLMLHILQAKVDIELSELAAFGISFPGGIKSSGRTVKVKINSVYMQKILQDQEDGADDY